MDIVAYEKKLIKDVVTSIERNGGKKYLSSIILTGSFGRDEPTYKIDEVGNLELKSDVEIALIYHKNKEKVEKIISNVLREFEEDLNLMTIDERRVRKACNFNFSIRVPKYKTIFTYDLFNGSKTIWGKNLIEERNIRVADIDIYEAKRLVANRIGELTYLITSTYENDKKEYLLKQWKGKLLLAIVTAWLICERKYVSSYRGQYEQICMNLDKINDLMGTDFFYEYENVFKFLRENGTIYEVPDDKMRIYVERINDYFINKSIKKSKVNSLSRLVKVSIKYIKEGINYGIIHFEDNILQALIEAYYKQDLRLKETAHTWHNVLY